MSNQNVNPAQAYPTSFPPQEQTHQPGVESQMKPLPDCQPKGAGSGKLQNKVALITGGDSGIGRAIALLFAQEGAHIVFTYLDEAGDAEWTKNAVEKYGVQCRAISGDLADSSFCKRVVDETISAFSRIDVLVNNAAEQHPQNSILDITDAQLLRTFETNIFSYFYMAKAALPHLKPGSSIINTTSVTAYQGNERLIDYSATKGAIVAFTRSLSQSLAKTGIRVNGVAPGPIWTPLIPSTFSGQEVASFGSDTPLGRAGQPAEVAPAYLYLATSDSTYVSGQVLHVNGGNVVNG